MFYLFLINFIENITKFLTKQHLHTIIILVYIFFKNAANFYSIYAVNF